MLVPSVIEGQGQGASQLQQARALTKKMAFCQRLSVHSSGIRVNILDLQMFRNVIDETTSKAGMVVDIVLHHQWQQLLGK